jgi:hypothetical protein
VIEIRFPEKPDLPTWYGVSHLYPTAVAAGEAYHLLREYDTTGRLNLGVYRHMRVGLDSGPVIVSVVGMDADTVEEAGRVLGGHNLDLHPATWLQLVKRRAEVMVEFGKEGKGSGSHPIPHSPEGDVIE